MAVAMTLLVWLKENYVPMLQCLSAIIFAGEAVTALIPSQSGFGFLSHIGAKLDALMDFLHVPYAKRAVELELPEAKK
jgi:hypothetical protein